MKARLALAVIAGLIALSAHAGTAWASLQLLQPDGGVAATFRGHGGYSSDGLGQEGTGGTVQAQVPAGSTVVRAYLYGTYIQSEVPVVPDDTTIDLAGTEVVMSPLAQSTSDFVMT